MRRRKYRKNDDGYFMMSSDLGTILVGEEAVEAGLIDENGSIDKAWNKLKFICQNKGEMV